MRRSGRSWRVESSLCIPAVGRGPRTGAGTANLFVGGAGGTTSASRCCAVRRTPTLALNWTPKRLSSENCPWRKSLRSCGQPPSMWATILGSATLREYSACGGPSCLARATPRFGHRGGGRLRCCAERTNVRPAPLIGFVYTASRSARWSPPSSAWTTRSCLSRGEVGHPAALDTGRRSCSAAEATARARFVARRCGRVPRHARHRRPRRGRDFRSGRR